MIQIFVVIPLDKRKNIYYKNYKLGISIGARPKRVTGKW
jgi:hypothetical protein